MNKLKKIISSHNLSQEQFAKIINVSRPTIAKILLGVRELNMSEARALSKALSISINEIYNENSTPMVILEKKDIIDDGNESMRISVPAENVEKFKNILLYITRKIGALPNVGQTVLYKLLYFSDFDYYEKYEEQLIGARYIRNHYGPTPVEFATIVKEMIEEGKLEEIKTKYFNKDQTKYIPVVEPDLSVFNGRELNHIDEEIDRLGSKSAKELSDFSHKDVPWIITPEGQQIDYESVFYRTSDTSVRTYDND